ncbi:MAG TPA: alpha-D-ribose 1-methylphosphonate 5-triphosphate diphosphatase [Acidisoma sp.]|uniref:alpha-D-ribose 1-methylphosphonate 5-triphosphate diphosphatase n=1 Tax=Acidisoma sp. TaxID=1872115 RepID=UPI002C0F28B6|nr:alpha-D-ribose 1-methylphosphonate 5-triphosphate diphosphatase [Acidisoma sp.]HTI02556.1 alpha-D-ribose 1-methylphosphonate 5-triphosphate diphosphatase [Acidisoma sp.]
MDLEITGGTVLGSDGLQHGTVRTEDGLIAEGTGGARRRFDAAGLVVLPGIVDLHGDAFERQVQPRPGVDFPMDVALAETEAQLLANGITTAFHGVTLSWEPGLRSAGAFSALLAQLAAHKPRAICDMRVHLRWEAFNLEALDLALGAIAEGQVHLLAFNDHTPSILKKMADPAACAKYSDRAGVKVEAFRRLADSVAARAREVPAAVARIAEAAGAVGIPMASHDDATVQARTEFRAMGARISDFPMNAEVARAATEAGDWVLMGSPNVVRGGSHMGWVSAASMVEDGLCRILTSDYFYPALLRAGFAFGGREGLAKAWPLISANPAAAAGLTDRGRIAAGLRADLVLVATDPAPRVVATIAGGQLAYLTAEAAARLH